MSQPKISVTYDKSLSEIKRLEEYITNSFSLEPKYQHFIAEVVFLRLFSILENCIKETALKLACEVNYRNGNIPIIFYKCRSMIDAEYQFSNYNRTKPHNLKWTKARFVSDSVKKIIPNTEIYRININNHALMIDEMRIVRNHIAHRASSTYQDYKTVIFRIFGASLRIQPGAFLTSTKRLPRPKIIDYISISKIIVNEITCG